MDYYQRVAAVISGILALVPIIIILRIRTKLIITFLLLSLIYLNFTSLKAEYILEHQQESFNRVDARNYYERIVMIKKGINGREEIPNVIVTNFKSIVDEKIEREIKFQFEITINKSTLEQGIKQNIYYFLKLKLLDKSVADFIRSGVERKNYVLLYDDSEFVLIKKNSNEEFHKN